MAKFNVVQKRKRAEKAERKRAIHGDPLTAKLKNKPQPLSVSGKRQRKLFKKWRRVCCRFFFSLIILKFVIYIWNNLRLKKIFYIVVSSL